MPGVRKKIAKTKVVRAAEPYVGTGLNAVWTCCLNLLVLSLSILSWIRRRSSSEG